MQEICTEFYILCRENKLNEAQLLFMSTNKTDYDTKMITDCFDVACAFGYLEMAQWLNQHYPGLLRKYNLECASHNGHIQMVKWLLNINPTSQQNKRRARSLALINGHLDIVNILLLDNNNDIM